MIEHKVSRGRLSAAFEARDFVKRMWERIAVKELGARTLLEEATKAVQLETGSSWPLESPCKEELELLRMSGDMRLDGTSMRQGGESGRLGGFGEK